jgi:predicted site-specific integrase-resolvase
MLISKNELAERLGVTPRTIDNWVERGLIDPPIKLGTAQQSRVRFPANAADAVTLRLASPVSRASAA